jgi:hypothetical protein
MKREEEDEKTESSKASSKDLPIIIQTTSKRKDRSDDELENEKSSKKLKRTFQTEKGRKSSKEKPNLDLKHLNEDTSSGLKPTLHGTIYQVSIQNFKQTDPNTAPWP